MPKESAKRFESWKWTIDFRTVISEFFSLVYEDENIGYYFSDDSNTIVFINNKNAFMISST